MQTAPRPVSSSTRSVASPNPRLNFVNTQTKLIDAVQGRILCIADIRGRLSALNDLAREANAKAIIHTGDFGFFESNSLERINDRTLRHLTMYSPLIPVAQRNHLLTPDNTPSTIRSTVDISLLSEFPLLLAGQIKLQVPVFTVWGACEDVVILEKFRTGTYTIDNLHVLDEATTRCLDVGGIKLRLLGLGGALVPHKMFDNGDGNATIAGGQGTMWTTALQIGELVDTAYQVFDPTETRLLVTHTSPGREGIIAQLGLMLKADLTISAGLHFRYSSSYNEFSAQAEFQSFRSKLIKGKETFDKVWDSVKGKVEAVIDNHQRILLDKALSVVERIPPPPGQPNATVATGEEPAWKNCWNWNLCDAAFGSLVLDIKEGRVSAELKSQGFNFAYRRTAMPGNIAQTPNSTMSSLPTAATTNPPTKGSTPVPTEKPASPLPKEVVSPLGASSPITPKENLLAQSQNKTNGASTPSGSSPGTVDKGTQGRKERKVKKEPNEEPESAKEKADTAVPAADIQPPQFQSGKATPIPEDVSNAPTPDGLEAGLKSPTTDSAGTRTPTFRRPNRHPWTLFVRMSSPANESDLQIFFGGEDAGVTAVKFGRESRVAFVDFNDETTMRAGLSKNNENLKDAPVEVMIANQDERSGRGGRGGSRGRGSRGRYTARTFSAAGVQRRNERRGSANGNTGDAA